MMVVMMVAVVLGVRMISASVEWVRRSTGSWGCKRSRERPRMCCGVRWVEGRLMVVVVERRGCGGEGDEQ